MKRCLLMVCVVLSLAADKKDPAKEELKKLQGTWEAAKVTYNGDDLSEDDTGKISMTVKGDQATVGASKKIKGEYGKVKLKLDPSTTPATIDISIAVGGQKGVTLEGIYKLEKDKLTVCAKVLGMDRPAKFESPAGESIVLIVLKKK
jgi:uncharacterized protein (TIGR03067 family)